MTERDNVLSLFKGEKPKWLPEAGFCMSVAGKLLMDLERPHTKEGYDWFGVHWLPQNACGGIVTHPDITQTPIITDIKLWRNQIKFPDLETIDWDIYARDVQADMKQLEGKMTFFMFEHGIFERLTLLMGFEEALMALLLEPDACLEYAEAMADFKIKLFDKINSLAKFDMVLYQDDLGSTAGPLMSLDTYRRILKGPTKRIFDHMKKCGLILGYHSCGKMDLFIKDLIEIGAQMINPLQSCNDQAAVKAEYGDKVVFHGGLNNQEITDIPNPNEEDLRKELRRCIDTLAPGGGFILEIRRRCMATNGLDTQAILIDEYERYGKVYYNK